MLANVTVDQILDDLEYYGHTEWAERLRKNLELACDTLDMHWQSDMQKQVDWMLYKEKHGITNWSPCMC